MGCDFWWLHALLPPRMSARPATLLFLAVLTALRLAFIGLVELSPDEAYYQMWSERLDWAYFSKGPGVALAMRAGTALFGVNEFGVRLFSPLLSLGTSLIVYWLARRIYGGSVAAWTVLLLNLTPIFTAGSLLLTIDPLSIFFWTAALAACWLAINAETALDPASGDRQPHRGLALGCWALTGAGVALGFLCKYTNAVELLSIALALAWTPRWRVAFRRPGFYLMLAVALLGAVPPLVWNADHAWVTLGHLRARGNLDAPVELGFTAPVRFWLAHFGVYSPLLFLGLLAALPWGWKRARLPLRSLFSKRRRASWPRVRPPLDRDGEHARFLLAFAVPLLGMYALLSLRTRGEPNWTAPAFISLGVLTTMLWHERSRARISTVAPVCALALLVAGLESLVALDTDLLRQAGFSWSYRRDPSARLVGWRTLARTVAELRAKTETELGGPVFLIANKYQTAAELNFYLPPAAKRNERPGHPPVYLPESQEFSSQFSFWPGYEETPPVTNPSSPLPTDDRLMTSEAEFAQVGKNPFLGRSALYVSDNERHQRAPAALENGFERCELLATYEIRRRNLPLRILRVFLCTNYQGAPL
jgi:4-amino-4-deoxy-L-arabinose transferase-like glycosyltransferase